MPLNIKIVSKIPNDILNVMNKYRDIKSFKVQFSADQKKHSDFKKIKKLQMRILF